MAKVYGNYLDHGYLLNVVHKFTLGYMALQASHFKRPQRLKYQNMTARRESRIVERILVLLIKTWVYKGKRIPEWRIEYQPSPL